jgi:transcription elongation factor GreB
VERPRVTQEVADAAAQGDRSENAEYIYGKRRLREIDRRVRFLSKRLDDVTVVNEPPSDSSRVFFGAWVTLEDDGGHEVTYRIVGPDESDLDRGFISMEAPVAKALLGKRDGDDVTVRRPKGDITYTIMAIRYREL